MPKRNLTKKKNNKQRGGRRSKKKRKNSSTKLKPENIGKILSDIHILLSFPSIEFLPSTNIFSKNNTGHYLQMIDYQDLAAIINKNPKYKKSPTIQKIFNYQSYKLENENEIVFNYNNIKCDNLIIKEQKNYNVKVLFLYLLECNIEDRLKKIIQIGGDDNYDFERMIDYDVEKNQEGFKQFEEQEKEKEKEKNYKEELEKMRELERVKYNERKKLEEEARNQLIAKEREEDKNEKEEFEKELKEQNDKVIVGEKAEDDKKEDEEEINSQTLQKQINKERSILNDIQESKEDIEERKEELLKKEDREIDQDIQRREMFEQNIKSEERKMKERIMFEKQELEKKIEIKVKGFEEFLEQKKVSNVSKNSFALYNVNWFNVCCGIEKCDEEFEKEIQKQITTMGLIINEEDIIDKLMKLFEDKDELTFFKNMMKNRLLSCSEIEPPSFFDKLFTDSFGTFKKCDERSPQSILYLYDEYTTFLEKNLDLTKLDRVLMLIYCETRQHVLSKYISLEIIRKENEKKKKDKIMSILDKIMQSDKSIIKKNDKLYEDSIKLKYKDYKEQKTREAEEQLRVKSLVSENNIVLQKNKLSNLSNQKEYEERKEKENSEPGFLDKLKGLFEKNTDSPIFELTLTPKEREAYERAMKKMKGGGNNLTYESTDQNKNEVCNKIKNEKNIYKNQLDMLNYC